MKPTKLILTIVTICWTIAGGLALIVFAIGKIDFLEMIIIIVGMGVFNLQYDVYCIKERLNEKEPVKD